MTIIRLSVEACSCATISSSTSPTEYVSKCQSYICQYAEIKRILLQNLITLGTIVGEMKREREERKKKKEKDDSNFFIHRYKSIRLCQIDTQ